MLHSRTSQPVQAAVCLKNRASTAIRNNLWRQSLRLRVIRHPENTHHRSSYPYSARDGDSYIILTAPLGMRYMGAPK